MRRKLDLSTFIVCLAVILGGVVLFFQIRSQSFAPTPSAPPPSPSPSEDTYQPYQLIECETAQDVVDFLSENAIQVCLEYHVFDDPNDWDINLFHLPPNYERVMYFSSGIFCYYLADSYYTYIRSHFTDEGTIELDEMIIDNEAARESTTIPLDLFPDISALLAEK